MPVSPSPEIPRKARPKVSEGRRRFWSPFHVFRATVVFPSLLLFAISIAAQDRALISGDIEDRQDNPIAGTQVILRNDSLRVERSTVTNSDGLYFFAEVVPAEGYVVTSTAAGLIFAPTSVKFDVEVGE